MLLLFDIDGTLLLTGGAGMDALRDAGRELFSRDFTHEGVAFAGRLDPLIIADLLHRNGVDPTPAQVQRMRDGYARHMPAHLARSARRALPGVLELLEVLRADARFTLGLLTGNFERTGTMKLAACGIDPSQFVARAWGDDSPHIPPTRADLVPVAMARAGEVRGRVYTARDAIVLGDTPHDVACAAAHGLRSVAVATGLSSEAELAGAGATEVFRDFSDTGAVLKALDRALDAGSIGRGGAAERG